AWRWHQARGLQAMGAGDGAGVVESLTRAIGASRRELWRHEAAGLWNDLGVGRAQVGDLAGAERAFLHALRLFGRCDGPRRTTLALHNLAEVRLRRGRLAGVREILEKSTAENRLAGNLRGLTQDHELWARCELAEGRPAAALALCRGALAALDAHGLDWRRSELHLFAARALGWLERREEAAVELASSDPAALAELEPEERPALLAHAGDRGGALRSLQLAPESPGRDLWQAVLDGQAPAAAAWSALAALEPYRAARLVFDLELAAPGSVPRPWRRTAIATLRRVGAGLLAERLEAGDEGPWQALSAYLAKPSGEPAACAALFAAAGYAGVELSWSGESGRRVLVAGAGGGQEITAEAAGGRLVLSAAALDAPLRALFDLVHRDLAGRLPAAWPAPEEVSRPVRAGGMIGESPALRAALDRLRTLAAGDLTILILGESGTGKELVAREVHRASPRSRRPFVVVNCAALSETLLLSDLFGHVRGAFTGADRDRAGVFETADGGTVFLDEIGDLPASAQGMLLRVLQEGEVRRVGESVARRVDVRTIAATHRDLGRMVGERSFRQDLFYRLKVGSIELPPLRDRGRDVLLLAEHFLNLSTPRASGGGRLSPQAQVRLLAHRWPGNIRELKNVIAVAAALAGSGVIEPEHLGLADDAPKYDNGRRSGYHQQVSAFRRQLVQEAITAGGSRAEAARRLGLSRQTLSYLVRQLGLL
ncbi:MAG TPA: sigma 54-interacting transcriptional regulator, partial [Thermoanaerobaculia bacterium]|nr:sigma 54-interacting transcriptional regulator [Thermoanaerobaculia bacterium]